MRYYIDAVYSPTYDPTRENAVATFGGLKEVFKYMKKKAYSECYSVDFYVHDTLTGEELVFDGHRVDGLRVEDWRKSETAADLALRIMEAMR